MSKGGGRGGGSTSCQVSPHFKLSRVSAITVSAEHNRGAVGERRTDLQIKHAHYGPMIIRHAMLSLCLCCTSTFLLPNVRIRAVIVRPGKWSY